jgi:hypothetical protein
MKQSGSQSGSGGGARVSNTEFRKREPIPNKVSVGATSRIGGVVGPGSDFKPLYDGRGYQSPVGPRPQVAGPGGGREVMRSGSQGTYGTPTAGISRPGSDAPIFPGFPGRRG